MYIQLFGPRAFSQHSYVICATIIIPSFIYLFLPEGQEKINKLMFLQIGETGRVCISLAVQEEVHLMSGRKEAVSVRLQSLVVL